MEETGQESVWRQPEASLRIGLLRESGSSGASSHFCDLPDPATPFRSTRKASRNSKRASRAVVEHSALRKLIGRSVGMQQVRDQIARIARSPVPVMIVGETGTGKELCAEAIALLSGRMPFLAVNCAAFPEGIVESELFGHERGAFTGAVRNRTGVIARADGGTLFLDELAEIPMAVQAKLLRTLQSGEYQPVGAVATRRSEFRILAAASGDLEALMASGRLRVDLIHRLGALRVRMPPLRERVDDIPLLTESFLRTFLAKRGAGPTRIRPDVLSAMARFDWPGNVRQLKNVVEAAATLAGDECDVGLEHLLPILALPERGSPTGPATLDLAEARHRAEQETIRRALAEAHGNRELAARLLRVSEATLYRYLKGRRPTVV